MKYFIALLSVVLFLAAASSTSAESLITVDEKGEASWNMLSAESFELDVPSRDFNLGYVAGDITQVSRISIKKDGEKVNLTSDGKSVDATGWKKNLVELVETPETQKIEIAFIEGKFAIKQRNAIAETSLPIKIDPKE